MSETVMLDSNGVRCWTRECDKEWAFLYTRDKELKESLLCEEGKYVEVLTEDTDGLAIFLVNREHCLIVNIPAAYGFVLLTSRNGRTYKL